MKGKEFREMRKEMGWTQYFLADVLGITRVSLAHYERDRAPVPRSIARALRKTHNSVTIAIARAYTIGNEDE